jgi:two-component system chemotaxis sensor kinase CheA
LILHSTGKRIAFLVDQVLGEQEVLVKRLGPYLARLRNVMGATVLGTGDVVPILDVPDLMNSAVKANTFAPHHPIVAEKNRTESKSVLIVEDSITARTLLKTIVESVGYTVKTGHGYITTNFTPAMATSCLQETTAGSIAPGRVSDFA